MAVHAHPDDESSKGAATLARYSAEGVQVTVVTCTGGESGDVHNPTLDLPEVRADIGAVRRAEMARSGAILGIEHRFLGFVDSGFSKGTEVRQLPAGCFARQRLDTAVLPLVRAVREFRPHVITTYDASGGYPHPDHVMCHRVAVEAFEAAGDPDRFPGQGDPWRPAKLYYHVGLHPMRMEALRREAGRRGWTSADSEWARQVALLQEHDPWPLLPVTTRVACAEYFGIRERALLAHRSQIDPDGFWFVFPADLQRVAWPTEDFHLARTTVETEFPEHDLFAGVAVGLAPAGVEISGS